MGDLRKDGGPALGSRELYTHHHYGWRKRDLPDSSDENLLEALRSTHTFLPDYEGKYRAEIKRTPECSFEGRVVVYWDSEEPKTDHYGAPLFKGDYWFTAFEFNAAPVGACRFCGGTGRDHYSALSFCWACDGTAVQIRQSVPRGFMNKPTPDCAAVTHRKYAEYLAAREASHD